LRLTRTTTGLLGAPLLLLRGETRKFDVLDWALAEDAIEFARGRWVACPALIGVISGVGLGSGALMKAGERGD